MSMEKSWSYETEFAAEPSSASQARAFVARHLLAHELPGLVDDVQQVASELATNAMAHAKTPITVVLWASRKVSSWRWLPRPMSGTGPAPRLLLHAVWTPAEHRPVAGTW